MSTNPGIGVSYDRDVAARTNMSVDRITGQGVTVTYDRDVAERTNMGRVERPRAGASRGRSSCQDQLIAAAWS